MYINILAGCDESWLGIQKLHIGKWGCKDSFITEWGPLSTSSKCNPFLFGIFVITS